MFKERKIILDKICEGLDELPKSNGSKYFKKSDLRIAIISDEFFYNSIKDSANFIYLKKSNWSEIFGLGVDLFLFETAWHGIDEEWEKFAWPGCNDCKEILEKILTVCKNKAIPSIFFSKEDPPDFYTFLDLARNFDVVFTSAVECIGEYKNELKHDRVYASSFCVNPLYNNPIGMHRTNQVEKVLFAGAWYKAFPERCQDQKIMFDGVLESTTTSAFFIDRFFTEKTSSQFPTEYSAYIYPGVNHSVLQKLHKRIRWAININSIRDSRTMFANRTFELLANGNLIISNYSLGVNDLLPTIFTINSKEEVVNILDKTSDIDKYSIQMAGIRSVLSNHTCFHRLNDYLKAVNLDSQIKLHSILVVIEDELNKVDFERQTYKNKSFCYKEDLSIEKISNYKMIAWFDKNYRYEPYYLEDMINGFKYTNCSYITKHCFVDEKMNITKQGLEHDYTNEFGGKFCSVCWVDDFDKNVLLKSSDLNLYENGYASDRLNVYKRKLNTKNNKRSDYKISLIVPLHNNAERFLSKGLESIKRSSLFDEIEVLLMNDGSDSYNTGLLENINEKYTNVRLFNLSRIASGSASRPRNLGIREATAEYIGFMDPDDELINDGLALLYNQLIKTKSKLCFGNSWLLKREPYLWNPFRVYKKLAGTDQFNSGFHNYLAKAGFMTPGISAFLVEKKLCLELGEEPFHDGAFAEDTFFMWQLMSLRAPMTMINTPVYNYFAEMQDSVTNSYKASFFYRSSLVIPAMKKWLEKNNLMDDYVQIRLEDYIVGWLFDKLKKSTVDEYEASCIYVKDIILSYYDNKAIKSKIIKDFLDFCIAKDYKGAIGILPKNEYKIKNFGIRNKPTKIKVNSELGIDEDLIYQCTSLSINKTKIFFKYELYKYVSKLPGFQNNERILLKFEKYKRLRKMLKTIRNKIIFM